MIEDRFKQFEARIKALEDLMQAVSRCFIAAPQKPQAKQESAEQTSDEVRILNKFPEHLRQHLTVEQDGRIIRTKFVSREYWQEMNEIAKGLGYKWWTNPADKKQSRWEKQ